MRKVLTNIMSRFKSSAELKASAREHLLGHYGTATGAFVIMGLLIGMISFVVTILVPPHTVVNVILYYAIMFLVSVLTGLFNSGLSYLYLKLVCGRPVSVGDLFYGFQLHPNKAVGMQAWITFLTYLASLPQIVITYMMNQVSLRGGTALFLSDNQMAQLTKFMLPFSLSLILSGVVSVMVNLVYAQAFFLLHDFPQYSAVELLKRSRRLMVHHKGRFFYLCVSFIPLLLLSLISSGLALLWVLPYMAATEAEFFLDLIRNNTEAA